MPHSHETTHNKMVKKALKSTSRQLNIPYPELRARFISGEGEILIVTFWQNLHQQFPETQIFNQVYHCFDCNKFGLEP